jgi:hypothetical protein
MKEDIPPPAEAATEMGVDTDDAPETLGTLVLTGVVVIVVIAVVSLLAGYYS